MKIELGEELLSATVEAMRDLQARYEAEACALARMDSRQARELAQERLESAKVASGLYTYFATL